MKQLGERPVLGGDPSGREPFLALLTIYPDVYQGFSYSSFDQTAGIDVITSKPMVSNEKGPDIQLSYPLIEAQNLTVGTTPTTSAPLLSASACHALAYAKSLPFGTPPVLHEPILQAGETEFFAPSGLKLTDFQAIVGDPGVIRPAGTWSWSGLDNVSLLAQNVLTEDSAQTHLFLAGVILAVAAAALVASAVEAVSAIEDARERRAAEESAESAPPVIEGDPPDWSQAGC